MTMSFSASPVAMNSANVQATQMMLNRSAPLNNMGIAAGALGVAIGGAIAGAIAAKAQQDAADEALRPLTGLVNETETLTAIENGLGDAIKSQGSNDIVYYVKPNPKLISSDTSTPPDRSFAQVYEIKCGAKESWKNSLVSLTADNRSLRFALQLTLHDKVTKNSVKRKVDVFTAPVIGDSPTLALYSFAGAGKQALLDQIRSAARMAMAEAIAPAPAPAAAGDSVRLVNDSGAFVLAGKISSRHDGYVNIVNADGDVAVVSAQAEF